LKDKDFRVLDKDEDPYKLPKDTNLACFYNPAHEIHLVQKPMPKAGKGQCVIKVRATGICGSDVHFWKHGRVGDKMVVRDENGAGHESAGEIIEVGEGVTEWKVGDRVAIEAGVPCAVCEMCKKGRYNACPDVVFFSTPPYHGTLTRFHLHPAAWLHRLPDSMSYEEGALCEPLAVALAGLERAELKIGDPTLIAGAGPIGIIAALSARAAGAEPLVITDLSEGRLQFVKKLIPGIRTVLIERSASPKDTAEKIKSIAGLPLRVCLECTGFESSIQTASYSVQFGGTVFIIGAGSDKVTFDFGHMSESEIDVKWQYRYANQYPKAIRLVSSGLINLKPLVTHRFPMEKAPEAFHTAADIKSGSIKCQIVDES